MKRAVLLVGEQSNPYVQRFIDQGYLFKNNNIDFEHIEYEKITDNELPKIDSKRITCMLYYPHEFRDKHIEEWVEKDGIYGGKTIGDEIDKYYNKVDISLRKNYDNIDFVNTVESIITDRDKLKMKNALIKHGVMTPKMFNVNDAKGIKKILEKGNELFIKVRFGGYGKAISYLTKDKWLTNIEYDEKINALQQNWDEFKDVTNNINFLNELLSKDIIIEEAIDYPTINGKKFDMRMYVVYNKIAHILPRTNDPEKIITNWSRGGALEELDFLDNFPEGALEIAKNTAISATKAFGVNSSGIDIMFSKDYKKAYALEGQTDAGLPQKNRFDMIEYLVKQIIIH